MPVLPNPGTEMHTGISVDTPAGGLQIEVISEGLAFAALSSRWNELLSNSADQSFFQTWEWVTAWWEAYNKGRELFIVVMRKNGDLVGIAPLYREKIHGPLGGIKRILRFIGDGSDDADGFSMIFDSNYAELCASSFCKWLDANSNEWDLLELSSMPEECETVQQLLSNVERIDWAQHRWRLPHLVLSLPATWEEYLAARPSSVCRGLKYMMRRAEKTFQLQMRISHKPEEILADLEILFELHQKRWREKGGPGKFRDAGRKELYRLLCGQSSQSAAMLYVLESNGKPISAIFGMLRDGTFYRFQSGYDTDFSKYSVGILHQLYVIQALGLEGVRVVDFLAGDEEYKRECGATMHHYVCLRAARKLSGIGMMLNLRSVARRGKTLLRNITAQAASVD